MTIYVVTKGYHDGFHIVGVCTARDVAQVIEERAKEATWEYDSVRIEEFETIVHVEQVLYD